MNQKIVIIAAMSENRVIGKGNALPWQTKGDLSRFKEMTMGWPCIMGRKTWESLPKKPLPGRLNIVISKSMLPPVSAEPVKICDSLYSAIECCLDYEKIFICGGESIYKQALPLANKIDLTLIPGHYDGDTYFPEIDDSESGDWEKTETVNLENFSIITYNKK
ncbi:MAG: dihydrofolate reductase [Treponema sp.]|nr:dihydrofolate reductase [Treponema sp.]